MLRRTHNARSDMAVIVRERNTLCDENATVSSIPQLSDTKYAAGSAQTHMRELVFAKIHEARSGAKPICTCGICCVVNGHNSDMLTFGDDMHSQPLDRECRRVIQSS